MLLIVDGMDNRVMSLELVRQGVTRAAMFGAGRPVLQPPTRSLASAR
jgi:hypothetical protein